MEKNEMMKWIAITALTSFGITTYANNAGSCYTISNHDARVYCLAKAHQDPARCYAIQESSKRAECLAELQKLKEEKLNKQLKKIL